jgi:hypothetical protein
VEWGTLAETLLNGGYPPPPLRRAPLGRNLGSLLPPTLRVNIGDPWEASHANIWAGFRSETFATAWLVYGTPPETGNTFSSSPYPHSKQRMGLHIVNTHTSPPYPTPHSIPKQFTGKEGDVLPLHCMQGYLSHSIKSGGRSSSLARAVGCLCLLIQCGECLSLFNRAMRMLIHFNTRRWICTLLTQRGKPIYLLTRRWTLIHSTWGDEQLSSFNTWGWTVISFTTGSEYLSF